VSNVIYEKDGKQYPADEYEWDDNTQSFVKKTDKLKQEIIAELLNQLVNNYVINITVDLTKGQGQGQFKKVK